MNDDHQDHQHGEASQKCQPKIFSVIHARFPKREGSSSSTADTSDPIMS
jgi:hypothetical protein